MTQTTNPTPNESKDSRDIEIERLQTSIPLIEQLLDDGDYELAKAVIGFAQTGRLS